MRELKNKKFRFFYHFNKHTKEMTIHYRKQCISCKEITCFAKTETKYNKIQPYLVMQGMTEKIEIEGNRVIIY